MNISANCGRCGSEGLRLEYHICNRNTHFVYRDFICSKCGYYSQLKEYVDSPQYQHEYYIWYSQTHSINDSYEQFTGKIISLIEARVIETVLKDEKGKQLKTWKGYVEWQEVYQFLHW